MRVFLMLAALFASVNGQTFHFGKCPSPPVQQEFDAAKYLGRWYEIAKLPAAFERGKCQQATYSLLKEGVIKIVNAELLSDGNVDCIEGQGAVKDPNQPAKLEVTFFNGVPDAPYWIVSTDYTSYAVVYTCTDFLGLFYVDFAWILGRSSSLSVDLVSKLRGHLESHGINLSRMTLSDQTDCDVMP